MILRVDKQWYPLLSGMLAGFLFFLINSTLFKAPADFPISRLVLIPEGLTLEESAALLQKEHVITSPTFFSIVVNLLSREKIIAGAYNFEKRFSVFTIALKTATGDYNVEMERLTLTEGMTLRDMAKECAQVLMGCSETDFLNLTKGKEGYLFPDTYLFLPSTKASEVVYAAEKNFDTKIATLEDKIQKFGKPLKDVIIMASIIEREANKFTDRQVVAGILWKRIEIGMPLQVDAVFDYVLGKNTYELTAADLKIDSPYNTYENKGLPPGPIGNPGLSAIEAALAPTASPYLYYLTGRDGAFHFAKTFPEHVKNKQKYLN